MFGGPYRSNEFENEPRGTAAKKCAAGLRLHMQVENRMLDNDKGSGSGGMLAAIVCAFILVFALIVWGPWSGNHVASNDGPSGTPGSTVVNQAPPPASDPDPSGRTTGSAR
jgi:hypothetical protein